ncbi:hypothetical protein BaRGS_00031899 [Batillaria attramentaria]|uniref:Mid2 domain-containing protein n=1 Tax=Batillaria attramentaria TaxID=370345 RepID=A0ABD0JPP3_9CAEN
MCTQGPLQKLLFCLLLWTYARSSDFTNNCSFLFELPRSDGKYVLTVVENTDVTLQFKLNPDCRAADDLFIRISKIKSGGRKKIVCNIWYSNGLCQWSQGSDCSCLPEGRYELKRTVGLTDSGTWTWEIISEPTSQSDVVFNITQLPEGPLTSPKPTSSLSRTTSVRLPRPLIPKFTLRITLADTATRKVTTRPKDSEDTTDGTDSTDSALLGETGIVTIVLGTVGITALAAVVVAIINRGKRGASAFATGASEAATDYEGYLVPVQAKKGADAGGLISPARVSSEDVSDSYERPVNPDYTTPNPVYQPLRHLYETVRQWRHSKRDSRSLDQDN